MQCSPDKPVLWFLWLIIGGSTSNYDSMLNLFTDINKCSKHHFLPDICHACILYSWLHLLVLILAEPFRRQDVKETTHFIAERRSVVHLKLPDDACRQRNKLSDFSAWYGSDGEGGALYLYVFQFPLLTIQFKRDLVAHDEFTLNSNSFTFP